MLLPDWSIGSGDAPHLVSVLAQADLGELRALEGGSKLTAALHWAREAIIRLELWLEGVEARWDLADSGWMVSIRVVSVVRRVPCPNPLYQSGLAECLLLFVLILFRYRMRVACVPQRLVWQDGTDVENARLDPHRQLLDQHLLLLQVDLRQLLHVERLLPSWLIFVVASPCSEHLVLQHSVVDAAENHVAVCSHVLLSRYNLLLLADFVQLDVLLVDAAEAHQDDDGDQRARQHANDYHQHGGVLAFVLLCSNADPDVCWHRRWRCNRWR